jgi:hypothetical protein
MLDEPRRKKLDHHFFERDRELIERMRQKADAARRERERQEKKALHWMKCPKCGHDMQEVRLGMIYVDKCDNCGGTFFDAGELDILLAAEKQGSLFHRLFGL